MKAGGGRERSEKFKGWRRTGGRRTAELEQKGKKESSEKMPPGVWGGGEGRNENDGVQRTFQISRS